MRTFGWEVIDVDQHSTANDTATSGRARNGVPTNGLVVDEPDEPDGATTWRCPVCTIVVPHPHRPGRARVYCTNSCKQRAYRWRRHHRHEISTPSPPERAHTSDRAHAVRSDDDFTSQHRTRCRFGQPRRLTACGTFAAAANEQRRRPAHTKFYAAAEKHNPQLATATTCRTCVALLGVPVEPISVILERLTTQKPAPASPPVPS